MKRIPIFSLATLWLLTSLQCQTEVPETNIQRDFARFDQAYLPVLFYVCDNNTYQAKRAVFHLEYHWQQLYNRYEFNRSEPEWRGTFRRVNTQLNEAYTAIDANNPTVALVQLEMVKQELMDFRALYHIEYYLDNLFEFQAAVDVLKATTEDEMLYMMEWEDVMDMAEALENKWKAVTKTKLEAAIFEFDENKTWKWHTTMESVSEKVGMVQEAMNHADRAKVAAASEKLDRTLKEVIRLFGSFEATSTYYVQNEGMDSFH